MTVPIPFLDDLVIVLVLFRQSLLECASYQSLNKALGNIRPFPIMLVYDNSAESQSLKSMRPELIYLHNPSNPGVGKAYNEGYKLAQQLTKKWLLLVDQDTEFPSTIFSDYAIALKKDPQISTFVPSLSDSSGLVSPFLLRWGKGKRISSFNSGIYSLKKYNIINSGMLVSVAAFEKAGGYDEQFPLDYSDISFCERLASHDPNFRLLPTRCIHYLSSTKETKDLTTDLERFKIFCKAVLRYKKISVHPVMTVWIILPRAFKLAIERNNLSFLKIGFTNIGSL